MGIDENVSYKFAMRKKRRGNERFELEVCASRVFTHMRQRRLRKIDYCAPLIYTFTRKSKIVPRVGYLSRFRVHDLFRPRIRAYTLYRYGSHVEFFISANDQLFILLDLHAAELFSALINLCTSERIRRCTNHHSVLIIQTMKQ